MLGGLGEMGKGYLPSDRKDRNIPSPWTGDGWSFDPKSIDNYSNFVDESTRKPRPGDLFLYQPNDRRVKTKSISQLNPLSTKDPLTLLTALFVFLIFLSPGLLAITIAMMGR